MTIPIGAPIRWTYSEQSDQTPMTSRATGLSGLLRLVSVVESAGATLPSGFTELRDRLLTFSRAAAAHDPILFGRLREAIVTGRDDPWLLFVGVMAERGPDQTERRSEVLGQLHDEVGAELRGMYQPLALPVYCALAGEFDRAANDLTTCARRVDPAAGAASVVDGDQKTLQAWRQALVAATRLEELLEPLSCASELVRPLNMPSGTGVSRVPFLLPLTCDSEGLHRRVIWHAWMDWKPPAPPTNGLTRQGMDAAPTDVVQNTRCGRWARLLAAGATLRANPNPAAMQMFGQLQPLGVRPVPQHNRAVMVRFDPEGDLEAAPKRGPLARMRDALRGRIDEPAPPEQPDILSTFGSEQE